MNISKKMETVLNSQIGYEFESAYIYLGLSAALNTIGFPGFSHWMRKQYTEELEHAMKIFDYVQARQGCIQLKSFECPSYDLKYPKEAFELAYEAEIKNTKHIHEAYHLAVEAKDYPTQIFLQWFINEQVEEEDNCQTYLDAFKLAKDCSCTLMKLDHDASKR